MGFKMLDDAPASSELREGSSPIHIHYAVDGFRSLNQFSLGLRNGINVIVGPNGSGKTNFLDFLDFIGDVLRLGASTAVSNSGGLSRAFSAEQKNANSRIYTAITGIADFRMDTIRIEDSRAFRFHYELEVKFSKKLSSIYISRESIQFKKLYDPNCPHLVDAAVGTASISRKSASDEVTPTFDIGPRLLAKHHRNPLSVTTKYASRHSPQTMLERIDPTLLLPDESILASRNQIPAFDAVRYALNRGRSFNVSSSIVKHPDDLTNGPGIMIDGSGLTSTLYALQELRKSDVVRKVTRLRKANHETLDIIVNWTKLLLPLLSDIQVVQDVHTGKYVGYLILQNDRVLKIPFQASSDGTVKWLAVVCYILTSSSLFTFEEPENYLHPKMQEFLIALIRDNLDEAKNGSVLISTHSETLINNCRPDELIIFSFDDFRTTCRRVNDPSRVSEEINTTGFGLGSYYASNALS